MNKFSLHQVLSRVPKRTAVAFGLLAAVLIPVGLYAWGPSRGTYTMAHPADHVTFNSITDNPDVGDERNFLRVREVGQATWSDTANLQAGKTYEARIYVHNNAAANLNLHATNVRAALNLPNGSNVYGKAFEVNAFVSADNATPNTIWDNMVLKSDKEFHVKVVSQKYYNNIRTEKSDGFTLSNDLFTQKGALLGYTQMNGDIQGCLQYSGYVLVKFTPVFKPEPPKPQPGYDVEKTVDKTTANPSDTIRYTITAKNTGNQDLTNVKINDQLPAYYSSASEDIKAPSAISGSIVKGGSVTIAKLPVGSSATITISYKIKDAAQLQCGTTRITNKVSGTTDQDKTEDNNGNNEVHTDVNRVCTTSYDVSKVVDKTTAKPGDTIKYTIVAKNTGKIDLTNVKINDKLPAYYSNASEKIDAPSKVSGSIIKDGSVTIDKLPVGKSVTITVNYKIKADKDMTCGETKIVNKVTSTTDQSKNETNVNNNQVTTTVERTCKYGYDLVKTVDKTAANPGDTLTYTLTFKNTGEKDLTNVVIKDVLPNGVTPTGLVKANPDEGVSGSLLKDGIKIAKVQTGQTVTLTFSVIAPKAEALQCGDNSLVNTASSTSKEEEKEFDQSNNSATTVINKVCTPETPPVTPPTTPPVTTTVPPAPTTPTPQSSQPWQPSTIAATGAKDVFAGVIGLGAIVAAITAYIRSRQFAKNNR